VRFCLWRLGLEAENFPDDCSRWEAVDVQLEKIKDARVETRLTGIAIKWGIESPQSTNRGILSRAAS
jgi:hypothetical protein